MLSRGRKGMFPNSLPCVMAASKAISMPFLDRFNPMFFPDTLVEAPEPASYFENADAQYLLGLGPPCRRFCCTQREAQHLYIRPVLGLYPQHLLLVVPAYAACRLPAASASSPIVGQLREWLLGLRQGLLSRITTRRTTRSASGWIAARNMRVW